MNLPFVPRWPVVPIWLRLAIGAAALVLVGWLWSQVRVVTAQRDTARAETEQVKAASEATVANFRAATARAKADDIAHARHVERRYAAANEETTRELTTRLADARALTDRYIRLHPAAAAPADRGGGGDADLPRTADAAGAADRAGEATIVPGPDLRICTENTVKAEGWREWWGRVRAATR